MPSRPIIWPQLGVGGLMPTPRKLSAASAKIARGMPSVTETMMGASELGSRWPKMMRGERAPTLRDASTNSFSRNIKNWLRVMRHSSIQLVMASAMSTFQ